MDANQVIHSQYQAALAMFEAAVRQCPAAVWDDARDRNRFWHVAYHLLYYTHLYLQPREEDFAEWPKARGEAQYFGPLFFEGNRAPVKAEPYTRDEIMEYLDFCRAEVTRQTSKLDLAAPSGFSWIPLNKLELQFYNIRHIQHHTGELYERLGVRAGADLPWVGQQGDQ